MIFNLTASSQAKQKHIDLTNYGFEMVGIYPPGYVDMILDQVKHKEPRIIMTFDYDQVMYPATIDDAPDMIKSIMNTQIQDQKVVYSMRLEDLLKKPELSHIHRDISAYVRQYRKSNK